MKNPIELQLAVARKHAGVTPLIDEQTYSIALPQKHLGQRGRRTRRMLKQTILAEAQIGFLASIQDEANIGDLFLLEFFGEELVRMPGRQTPVQAAQWIHRMIFAHAPEVRTASAEA